jgi:ATP-binding cassette subfamily F protein 3
MRVLQQTDATTKAAKPGEPAKSNVAQNGSGTTSKRKRRFPYRKIEDLEKDIAACETKLRTLEEKLASPDLYREGEKVKDVTQSFEETKVQLQQLYEHWEEAVELN